MFQAKSGSPSSGLPGVGSTIASHPGHHPKDAAILKKMLEKDKFYGTTASKNTTAEANRVAFFYPASAVFGSHVHTDLDSYLALVRRKVQEKFATTVELITHIRRHRSGENVHVTPNEFRYTLIKLGVILPPATSDAVFNIFDSDRSGSINFDEFAMWVMNSEFKPKDKKSSSNNDAQTRVDFLRDKLTKWAKKHPDLMREQISSCPNLSFTKMYEAINRKFMRITEPEVREMFSMLDLQKQGMIDGEMVQHWIHSGKIEKVMKPTPLPKTIPILPLNEAINRVCGKNVHQLEWCFLSAEKDPEKWQMRYEDFLRNLTEGGLGKNVDHVKSLFVTLGGSSSHHSEGVAGFADIRRLLLALPPLQDIIAKEKAMRLKENAESSGYRPMSAKAMSEEKTRLSQMDRYLREMMRKAYDLIHAEFDSLDVDGRGFIDSEILRAVIVKFCCPIAPKDFELIVREIRKDPSSDRRVSWPHFLQVYGTRAAPNALQGPGFHPAALLQRKKELFACSNADKTFFLPRPKHALTASKQQRPHSASASAGVRFHALTDETTMSNGNNGGGNNNNGMQERPRSALVSSEVRQRPHSAGPDFHKSFSVQSLSVVSPSTTTPTVTTGTGTTTTTGVSSVSGGGGIVASSSSGTGGAVSNHRSGQGSEMPGALLPVGGGLAATRQRIAETRARLQAFFREGVEPGKGGGIVGSSGGVVSVSGKKETEAETDIRRTWAAVLKDCHRCDSDGSGCITREEFLFALSNGNLKDTLDDEGMEDMATKYAIAGSEGRVVDYLLCFKTYLLEAAEKYVPSEAVMVAEAVKKTENARAPNRQEGYKHPWEFDYKREKQGVLSHASGGEGSGAGGQGVAGGVVNGHRVQNTPYWAHASTIKTEVYGLPSSSAAQGIAPPAPISVQRAHDYRAATIASTTTTLKRAGTAGGRSAKHLSSSDRETLLNQYDKDIVDLCAKCYTVLKPLWKELRNEFKHNQIKECRGHIVNYYFTDCLKKFGVSLNVWEQPKLAHAFRVKGQHGVVNFDDFQRICVLTKLHKKVVNMNQI